MSGAGGDDLMKSGTSGPGRGKGLVGEHMTWVEQVVALPGGFVGSMAVLDLDSGHHQSWLFRLDSHGSTLDLRPDGPALASWMAQVGRLPASGQAAFVSPLIAAAATPALRSRLAEIRRELDRRALPFSALVSIGPRLWILAGAADEPGAIEQQILAADLNRPGELALHALPLDGLNLSETRRITVAARLGAALAVAVADPVRGFDLFRLEAEGTDFLPVLTEGAGRFALNAAISAVAGNGKGGLLLGTAALAGPEDEPGNWGPELIDLMPDGNWDLVFGTMRFTPDRMAVPLSGMKPGLGDSANAAVRAIATGRVGGRPLTCVALQGFEGSHVQDRRAVQVDLMAYHGAVRLQASHDLQDWFSVPVVLPAGSGSVNVLAVTDQGLLIGHEGSDIRRVPVFLARPST